MPCNRYFIFGSKLNIFSANFSDFVGENTNLWYSVGKNVLVDFINPRQYFSFERNENGIRYYEMG